MYGHRIGLGKSWAPATEAQIRFMFEESTRIFSRSQISYVWVNELTVEKKPSPKRRCYPTSLIRSPQSPRPGRIARGKPLGQRRKQWAGRKPEYG